jgi:CBS domain-containing protein
VIRTVARSLNPSDTRVKEVMSGKIYYCYEDQPIEDAVAMMEREQIRRLPIVNRERRLVGIVSLGDVATRGDQRELSSEALEEISKSASPAA